MRPALLSLLPLEENQYFELLLPDYHPLGLFSLSCCCYPIYHTLLVGKATLDAPNKHQHSMRYDSDIRAASSSPQGQDPTIGRMSALQSYGPNSNIISTLVSVSRAERANSDPLSRGLPLY